MSRGIRWWECSESCILTFSEYWPDRIIWSYFQPISVSLISSLTQDEHLSICYVYLDDKEKKQRQNHFIDQRSVEQSVSCSRSEKSLVRYKVELWGKNHCYAVDASTRNIKKVEDKMRYCHK